MECDPRTGSSLNKVMIWSLGNAITKAMSDPHDTVMREMQDMVFVELPCARPTSLEDTLQDNLTTRNKSRFRAGSQDC